MVRFKSLFELGLKMQNRQVIPLLREMLSDLPCSNISVIDTDSNYIFCGFKSNCSMITSDLKHLLQPLHVYRAGEKNYIAVYSRDAVAAFIEKKFKTLIRNIMPIDCHGYFDNDCGYVFDSQLEYQRFIKKRDVLEAAWAAGLDYGWKEKKEDNAALFYLPFRSSSDLHFNFFRSPTRQPPQMIYWLNFCSESTKIYKTIFSGNNEQRKSLRLQRQTFLQGKNPLSNELHQNQDIIKNIFSFLTPSLPAEEKSLPVVECTLENNELETNNFIREIKTLISKLEKEIENSSDSIKQDKVKFLKLVLNFKKANHHFALHECLHLTEILYPQLYTNALIGLFSRTKKLIRNIKENNELIKTSPARIAI